MHTSIRHLALPLRFLLLVSLLGCQSYGTVQVETDHDPRADFTHYRTFAQAPAPTSLRGSAIYSEIAGRKLRRWIDAELEKKGLVPVAWDEADLQVAFSVDGRPRTEVWVTSVGWYGSRASVVRYREGSLAIDIVDRAQRQMIWHGLAHQKTLENDFSDEHAQRAVAKLLERYPPKAEKTKKRRKKAEE